MSHEEIQRINEKRGHPDTTGVALRRSKAQDELLKAYKKRDQKYNSQPTWIDGIRFASKKEANRYKELKLLLEAKVISNLKHQVNFKLIVQDVWICTYRADFVYKEGNKTVVEDTKGYMTPDFKIKWKLAQVLYPKFTFQLI